MPAPLLLFLLPLLSNIPPASYHKNHCKFFLFFYIKNPSKEIMSSLDHKPGTLILFSTSNEKLGRR
jgi:hypothetical protein